MMIPQHTKEALIRWVKDGNKYDHGSFLTALVSNDLMGSFSHADDINLNSMLDIVRWMHSQLPVICHGSQEKAKEWKGMPKEIFNLWIKGI